MIWNNIPYRNLQNKYLKILQSANSWSLLKKKTLESNRSYKPLWLVFLTLVLKWNIFISRLCQFWIVYMSLYIYKWIDDFWNIILVLILTNIIIDNYRLYTPWIIYNKFIPKSVMCHQFNNKCWSELPLFDLRLENYSL